MYPPNQNVILSIAKNLYTSTLCFQILHYVQNDTKKKKWMCISTHPLPFFIPQFPQNTPDVRPHTLLAWRSRTLPSP